MMRFPYVLSLFTLAIGCSSSDTELMPTAPAGELAITTPAAADWLAEGEVLVEGTVTAIDDVALNGAATQVSGGVWSGSILLERGVNLLEATGLDARGDVRFDRHAVLAGTFADPTGAIDDGLTFRVNQGGLDAMVDMVATKFDTTTLEDAAFELNPVYEYSYEILGYEVASANVEITGFSTDDLRIDIDPQAGQLEVTVDIEDIDVDLYAYGEAIGYEVDADASVWAELAEVIVYLSVDADDGELIAALKGATVELYEFGYDLSMIPDEIEPYLFVDTLRDGLEEMILEQVEEVVPELIQDALAELDPNFGTEMMGVSMEIGASFTSAEVDTDGLAVGLAVDIDAVAAGTHSYAGYLTADAGTAALSTSADLAFALSDDLLNRLLFEGWQSGVADQTLSTSEGSLDSTLAEMLKADDATVQLFAHLPPVVVERAGDLEVQFGELDVEILTPGGLLGERLLVSVTAWVEIDPEVVDGRLGLDAGDTELVITVRESDWGASSETTTALIEALLPFTIGDLVDSVGFDLPSFQDVSVETGGVDRDPSGVHTRAGLYIQ
jgi:hypothetical protein